MTGVHGTEVKTVQVFSRPCEPFRGRCEQVKTADDIGNLPLAADLPGVLRDITDPRMRAARDDDE